MIFCYGKAAANLRKKGLFFAVGVVAIPLSLQMRIPPSAPPVKPATPLKPADARVTRLHHFLKSLDCPVADMATDFVAVADQDHLDWRLLPSIAVIESGGGKAYKNNNIFGWNGGEQSFATIRSGMELVAYRLAHSPIYRRRSSFEKLRIYNEDENYADMVLSVMSRISPDAHLRRVSERSNGNRPETYAVTENED